MHRLKKQGKEEHTFNNPVYCDTVIKEHQKDEKKGHPYSTSLHKEGQYSLAGPGMPLEVTEYSCN